MLATADCSHAEERRARVTPTYKYGRKVRNACRKSIEPTMKTASNSKPLCTHIKNTHFFPRQHPPHDTQQFVRVSANNATARQAINLFVAVDKILSKQPTNERSTSEHVLQPLSQLCACILRKNCLGSSCPDIDSHDRVLYSANACSIGSADSRFRSG